MSQDHTIVLQPGQQVFFETPSQKKNPIANIKLGSEKQCFSPKSGTRQECLFSELIHNILLEVLDNVVRQDRNEGNTD